MCEVDQIVVGSARQDSRLEADALRETDDVAGLSGSEVIDVLGEEGDDAGDRVVPDNGGRRGNNRRDVHLANESRDDDSCGDGCGNLGVDLTVVNDVLLGLLEVILHDSTSFVLGDFPTGVFRAYVLRVDFVELVF